MMSIVLKKARAELVHREWVEFELELDPSGVAVGVRWRAWGCHDLIHAAELAAAAAKGQALAAFQWPGTTHSDLLIQEAFDRMNGRFDLPIKDPETCHCRRIPTAVVDEAIVLGAHTPETVTAWTRASTGCGTCRPDVEKLIAYRLKKAA